MTLSELTQRVTRAIDELTTAGNLRLLGVLLGVLGLAVYLSMILFSVITIVHGMPRDMLVQLPYAICAQGLIMLTMAVVGVLASVLGKIEQSKGDSNE